MLCWQRQDFFLRHYNKGDLRFPGATMSNAIDFSREVEPSSVGMKDAELGSLVELFEEQIDKQHLHEAAQLVVLRHGQVVLDRAYGHGRRGRPIRRDDPFFTFSATKPFTAMCVHKLVEEGRVDLDAPVARYWPEFGCNGKEMATIRHTLLHQAGIPSPHIYRQVLSWTNWQAVCRLVAGYTAEFVPGTRTAYHLVNFGFILGEVVRRAGGKMVDEYLMENFQIPLGMQHSWMRIPARIIPTSPRLISKGRENRLTCLLFNIPAYRRALIPAASLHASARDLAIFYQMLLNKGEYAGKRVLAPGTIERALQIGSRTYDETLKIEINWGLGIQLGGTEYKGTDEHGRSLGNNMGSGSSQRTFGHFGLGTCMAWADPDAQLVVTFTCNGVQDDDGSNKRWIALSNAVWRAVVR
jgi:CubicO group peptidase (beta-lactamase class C family)